MFRSSIAVICLTCAVACAVVAVSLANQPVPGILGGRGERHAEVPRALGVDLAGRWTVTFSNGVVETCEISQNGTAQVDEPQRSSKGTVRLREGDVVLKFEDDRFERWTPVGSQMVVEHWFPISAFVSERPVLGIAVRSGE